MSKALSFTLAAVLALPTVALTQSAPPNLTDPEVAHVAVTANTIDVDLGKLAESRTSTPEVKRFAAMMVRDHSAVNERAGKLADKLGVTPKDNAVSRSLETGAKEARAKVEPLEGAEFDQAYIDREIGYHQAVLDALDQVLIPTTDNKDLKQLLVEVRPAFASHLAYAKQVGQKLHASR